MPGRRAPPIGNSFQGPCAFPVWRDASQVRHLQPKFWQLLLLGGGWVGQGPARCLGLIFLGGRPTLAFSGFCSSWPLSWAEPAHPPADLPFLGAQWRPPEAPHCRAVGEGRDPWGPARTKAAGVGFSSVSGSDSGLCSALHTHLSLVLGPFPKPPAFRTGSPWHSLPPPGEPRVHPWSPAPAACDLLIPPAPATGLQPSSAASSCSGSPLCSSCSWIFPECLPCWCLSPALALPRGCLAGERHWWRRLPGEAHRLGN